MKININERIDTRAGSGKIEKVFHGSSSYGYWLGIDWKVNSQSASSNSSNVTATVYIRTTGSGISISSSATKDVSVTINGTKYLSTCTVGIGTNSKKNLLSKTVTVKHNSDGTKTCSFACALDINVTLGGIKYTKITHSGNGTFDTINLNSAPVWVSGGRVTIKNGSTILTDQANGTENAVKFPENVSSLNLSWSGATDANGDTITYELYEQVDDGNFVNIYTGTAKSLNNRSIGSGASTQGKRYDYYVKAKDSKGVYASGTQDGTQVQKNTLNGSTLASNSSILHDTTSIAFTWNAASNTDGSAVKYDLTASGLTINRATNLTSTSLTIAIVDTAPSTGAYILKSDLKNKFSGSEYNGNLSFTLTVKNNYGSTKISNKSISVNLRKKPTPATPTINKNANSTAYHTVKSTGNSYFVPDGTKTIRVSWSGGSDYLGTALKYDVQVKVGNGSYDTKHSNLTGSYCDIVLPKQSTTQKLSIRLITKTSYNYTEYKDSTEETLHFYNPPSIDLIDLDRTSTSATAIIRLNANTSIPNVNFPTRTYSGVSSGTLTNTRDNQTITTDGLKDISKYNWTISVIDDVGLYTTAVTRIIEIPGYTPLFSVREKGVGVNCIPNGEKAFMVNGGAKINGGLIVDGKDLLKEITKSLYPVGSIYMSTVNTNPSSYFGGTWVTWGAGKVPVGVNASETEFNTVEKTGGSKSYSASHTHTTSAVALTVAQLPAHNHSASTNSTGSHTHNIQNQKTKWGYTGSTSANVIIDATSGYTAVTNKTTTSAGGHSHSVTVNNTGSGQTHGHGNTGSSSVSLSAIQPYITCYMWKRTA